MFRSALIVISVFAFGFSALAKKTEHRHHGAHVHGKGQMSIAFDGAKGEIDFHTAAIGIVGFEHAAKSAADKKTKDDAFAKFENQIMNMVHFDGELNCKYAKKSMDMKKDSDGDHSDFNAQFVVQCDKSPAGTKVVFNFSMWPGMHEVDATVLVGNLQKTATINAQPVTLELK
jgi:hypothetical protein